MIKRYGILLLVLILLVTSGYYGFKINEEVKALEGDLIEEREKNEDLILISDTLLAENKQQKEDIKDLESTLLSLNKYNSSLVLDYFKGLMKTLRDTADYYDLDLEGKSLMDLDSPMVYQSLSTYNLLLMREALDREFKPFYDEDWSSITISYGGQGTTIDEASLVHAFLDQIYFRYETHGPISDPNIVPKYKYVLRSDQASFDLYVYNEDLARIVDPVTGQDRFFEMKIANLGHAYIDALVPQIEEDVIGRLSQAGYLYHTESKRGGFQSFRISSVASVIKEDYRLLDQEPTDMDDEIPSTSYTAMYCGDPIVLTLYKDYLRIEDGHKTYWYRDIGEDEDYSYPNFDFIYHWMFGAG